MSEKLTPKPARDLLVERDTMTQAAFVCHDVIADPSSTEERRDAARKVFDDLNSWLRYSEAAGGRWDRVVKMMPAGMKWAGFYRDMLDEFLLDLGAEVVEAHPALVEMARHAANLADTDGYSLDFRLDALDSLNVVLAALKRAAEVELAEAKG
jgi:hypothetical protein